PSTGRARGRPPCPTARGGGVDGHEAWPTAGSRRGSNVSQRIFRDRREFKSWNDAMAEKYDLERFHDHPSPLVRYIEQKRIRRILALLTAGPDDRVLEIGCGAGHVLVQLPVGRRFGMDLAETLLAKAVPRLGGTRGLVQADAECLPFADRTWD